jgi:hypothetical protein
MSRSRLVILDANIVIYLHEIGLWPRLLDHYEITLARTVAEHEALFCERNEERHGIDLTPGITTGQIQVVDVLAADVVRFRGRFDPLYLEGLDPGETESLAYLLLNPQPEMPICSADKIVYRVLPHLGLADRGVALEELLARIGLGRTLPHCYSRAYRERWTRQGEQDWIGGLGSQRGSPGGP